MEFLKLNKSRINVLMIVLLGLVLQACPILIVNDLVQREIRLDSLRNNHRPNYLSKSISYDEYSALKKNRTTSVDSSINISNNTNVLDFRVTINNIKTDKFPNEISIELVIADTNGVYLKNLAPPFNNDYAEIWDKLTDKCKNGIGNVHNLKVEEVQSDNSPNYAIAFVLDHSGSMGEAKVNKLQAGVIELVQYLKEPDMVSITKFTDEMYTTINMTRDKFFVLDSFKVVGMEGIGSSGTAYYDAIEEGLKQLENAPDDYEKIIIAFTDGGDGSSESTKEEVIPQLLDKKVKLFNVGYGYADIEVLEDMSTQSNGKFYMTISSKEFPYVLRDIYLKLSNYFRITYTPEDCEGLHSVNIPINLPNNGGLIVGTTSYEIDAKPVIEVGDVVFLNIEFEVGKSTITNSKSLAEIRKIAKWMKDNPTNIISVKGHTDNSGETSFNQQLSEQRANSVKAKLVEYGIDKARINTEGYGDTKPLYDNDSEENKRKNRRTEIELIK